VFWLPPVSADGTLLHQTPWRMCLRYGVFNHCVHNLLFGRSRVRISNLTTTLHGVTTQKTSTANVTTVKASKLASERSNSNCAFTRLSTVSGLEYCGDTVEQTMISSIHIFYFNTDHRSTFRRFITQGPSVSMQIHVHD